MYISIHGWALHNSSPPSAAYMRQWIKSTLVQIMACRLFGAKQLSKLSTRPLGTNFSEMPIKIRNFSVTKMYLKISPAKWRPFFPGGVEYCTIHGIHSIGVHYVSWDMLTVCCALFWCGFIITTELIHYDIPLFLFRFPYPCIFQGGPNQLKKLLQVYVFHHRFAHLLLQIGASPDLVPVRLCYTLSL